MANEKSTNTTTPPAKSTGTGVSPAATKVAANFFGMTLDAATMIPSLSVLSLLVAKQKYKVLLVVDEMKTQQHALDQGNGMMIPIVSLVIEYHLKVTAEPGWPADVNLKIDKQSIWLPVMWAEAGAKPSADEIAKLDEKIARGEEALAGICAYISSPLSPDKAYANRNAPRGSFMTGWHDLAKAQVPGEIKPSNGTDGRMWLNFTALRKGSDEDVKRSAQSSGKPKAVAPPP